MLCSKQRGFTLIEVLLALAIMSIALTALLLSTGEAVRGTARLKEKSMAHIVTTQALTLIQLELAPLSRNQEITQEITLFGQTWFWHAKASATGIQHLEKLEITASTNPAGPFNHPLTGVRRVE